MSPEPMALLIRERCLQKGWDLGELAREASVSRTTLTKILQGRTPRPHLTTLSRIAAALGIDPHDMGASAAPHWQQNSDAATAVRKRRFDEATNAAVAETMAASPAMASGWDDSEWDELYSTFGVGGQLTPEGVRATAAAINRKGEVVRKLQIVLESHLSDVAETLIQSLYGMIAIDAAPKSGQSGQDRG